MNYRRHLAAILLASAVAACGSPLEQATGAFMEQVRLGDPAAQQTYAANRELFESAEALPIWMDALANADSPQVRRWAATLVGNIGDTSALPALTEAMSGARSVREAAIDAISSFDAPDAAAAFAAVLGEGTRDAQAPALTALARMGADAGPAVGAVADAATTGENLIANTAINTLADIGSDDAVAALAEVASDASLDMARRKAAIHALQRVDSEAAIAALAEVAALVAEEEGADDLRDAL
jgi:hypothetical protein